MADADRYRPVGDYALLSDCHAVVLVSRLGNAAAVALAQPYGPGAAVAQHAIGAGRHQATIEGRP